jgi:hypothetical protein
MPKGISVFFVSCEISGRDSSCDNQIFETPMFAKAFTLLELNTPNVEPISTVAPTLSADEVRDRFEVTSLGVGVGVGVGVAPTLGVMNCSRNSKSPSWDTFGR